MVLVKGKKAALQFHSARSGVQVFSVRYCNARDAQYAISKDILYLISSFKESPLRRSFKSPAGTAIALTQIIKLF